MPRWKLAVLAFAGVAYSVATHAKTLPSAKGTTRIYYIAADEVEWDYAPSGANRITGKPFEGDATLWVVRGPDQLGPKYRKTIFREYTDATFSKMKPRAPQWEHLGILGPLVRAEVGDTIRVFFKNNGAHPFSLHPHGVLYDKESEGAEYDDGMGHPASAPQGVLPGGTRTYTWPVPERAGPSHSEGSSALWMYHSHIDEEKDVNAGLVGPLIVTARGMANPDGSPKDVDKEIVAGFVEMDENLSWQFDDNIQKYAEDPAKLKKTNNFADTFYQSNVKDTINGFLFGHTPPLTMQQGQRVRWYLLATTNFEVHAPHWHGNTVIARHMRTDVTSLLPMDMVVADMVPDNVGTWLFHCHTGPHLRAGMVTRYTVTEKTLAAAAPAGLGDGVKGNGR